MRKKQSTNEVFSAKLVNTWKKKTVVRNSKSKSQGYGIKAKIGVRDLTLVGILDSPDGNFS